MVRVGDIISSALEFKEIKQKQIAQDLNIQYSTFNNYVSNTREPDFETMIKIFTYLEIDLNEVFKHNIDMEHYKISKDEAYLLKLYRSIPANQKKNAIAVNENLSHFFIGNNTKES